MMKTSVFALAQRGPDGGEGQRRGCGGFAHERHLPSLQGKRLRPRHNAGYGSPPGKGVIDQQVGVCAQETPLLGGHPWLCPGDFATLSCLRLFSTKRSFPGDCSRAEEEAEGGGE